MKKEIIYTNKAPNPVGPYSQAVKVGDFLYCSGQIPLDISGEIIKGDISLQTEKVMENIDEVLKAAQLSYNHVVKTLIFIRNMDDFSKVNSVYEKYFIDSPPARSCVEVSRLPKDVDVEIEVIAKY